MRIVLLLLLAVVVATSASGCRIDEPWRATPRYPDRVVPPPTTPPPVRYCNDHTGHIAGKRPFYAGGECCCTPSLELIAAYRRDGWFQQGTLAELEAGYSRRGIVTRKDHDLCNNLCQYGPHVVKGGRCLVPPTPATLNYEEVITGEFSLTPHEAERVEAHNGRDAAPGR
ncbi:MAG: hypothetical protein AAF581_05715 [Planctomycetota bacterium]